ncbi:MAG: hypothetical protein ACOCZ7_02240, partial [Armatimonadota bacterium]
MHKTATVLLLIMVTFTACAAEVIFEEHFDEGVPEGWHFLNQRGECSGEWDATEPPGERAGSLRCTITDDLSARATWQAPRIDLKPATTYRMTFRTMLGDIAEGGRGAYAILYQNGEPSPDFWHMTEYMIGSRDWHERELVFTTREDTEWGQLQLKLWEAPGYVWYDDLVIEELGPGEVRSAEARAGRLVLPEDDGFALQTIFYPAHRRLDTTLHLVPERFNPVAFFAWGDAEQVADP